jgi:hypothetical protein
MRRITTIAALQGNSAYLEAEGGTDMLQNRVKSIEDAANEAISSLYSPRVVEVNEDPYGFFEAGRQGMKRNGLID